MKTILISFASLALTLSALNAQSVPPYVNYQGRVTDSAGVGLGTGTPVNRKVVFRIYDAPTGGSRLWTEEHTVTLANGEFSILLGNGIVATGTAAGESRPDLGAIFSGADRYLGITVDNGDNNINGSDTEIAPRQRITSTAYSLRAATAAGVANGTDLTLQDANHGLGWYGGGRLFNGQNIDGPVLFGWSGGALGSKQNGAQTTALRWDGAGNVGIGNVAPTERLDVTGNLKVSGNIIAGGSVFANGVRLPGAGAIDDNFVGTVGNYIAFGHGGNSEDFLSFKSNTFYLRDSPGGGDTTQPTLDVGGNIVAGGYISSSGSLTVGSVTTGGSLNAGSISTGGSLTAGSISTGGALSAGSVNSTGSIGGATLNVSGNTAVGGNLIVTQATKDLQFIDGNHGLGYYGNFGSRPWNGLDINGPVLYGYDGGALGTNRVGARATALRWSNAGDVDVTNNLSVTNNLTSKGKSVPVAEEQLRFVRGTVNSNGTIKYGSGFTVSGTNEYTITFSTAFTGVPSITATSAQPGYLVITVNSVTASSFKVQSRLSDNNNFAGGDFSFIVAGPR